MENFENYEEVSNEVTEVVFDNPTPVAEETEEMGFGEAVVRLGLTVATGVGLVTIGKKAVGGAKKLFGKIRNRGKKEETEESENCEIEEE